MPEERLKRKLSAIFSADVEGYSRLMGDDEASTVRTLESYRKVMADLIDQFRGRVVDSPGDNLLAVFGSVVDAVQCAVEIQEVLKAKNVELSEDRKMQFRIGVELRVEVQIGEAERRSAKSTDNFEAWTNVAKGGKLFLKGSKADNLKARALFEAAIKLDPGYADAWQWLASSHGIAARVGGSESRAASMKLAHEYIQKALALDDKSPGVHAGLGSIYFTHEINPKLSLAHYRRRNPFKNLKVTVSNLKFHEI